MSDEHLFRPREEPKEMMDEFLADPEEPEPEAEVVAEPEPKEIIGWGHA